MLLVAECRLVRLDVQHPGLHQAVAERTPATVKVFPGWTGHIQVDSDGYLMVDQPTNQPTNQEANINQHVTRSETISDKQNCNQNIPKQFINHNIP